MLFKWALISLTIPSNFKNNFQVHSFQSSKWAKLKPKIVPIDSIKPNINCWDKHNFYNQGTIFRGKISKTKNGQSCQFWSRQFPTKHRYQNSNSNSNTNTNFQENFCTNIDGSGPSCIPWKLFGDAKLTPCDVPVCEYETKIDTSTSFAHEGARDFQEILDYNNNGLHRLQVHNNLPSLSQFENFNDDGGRRNSETNGLENLEILSRASWQDLPRIGPKSMYRYVNLNNVQASDAFSRTALQEAYVRNSAATREAVGGSGSGNGESMPIGDLTESTTSREMSTTTTTTRSRSQRINDNNMCKISDQAIFVGQISTTKNGHTCQRWDAGINPMIKEIHKPNYRPSGNIAHNYCRNPDGDSNGEWCYTTDPNVRFDYCDIPICQVLPSTTNANSHFDRTSTLTIPDPIIIEDELEPNRNEILTSEECLPESDPTGLYYMGRTSKTKSGRTCQFWDVSVNQAVHIPKYKPTNPSVHKNYCRNPDGDSNGIWCYTTDVEVRFEYCEQPEPCRSASSLKVAKPVIFGQSDSENSQSDSAAFPMNNPNENGSNNRYVHSSTVSTSSVIFNQPNQGVCGRPEVIPAMIDMTYRNRRSAFYNPRSNRLISSAQDQEDQTDESLDISVRGRRIFNGDLAQPEMYPWLVLIRTTTDMCGGTIIASQFVMTAAHCAWDPLLDRAVDRTHVLVYAGIGSRLDDWRYNTNIQRRFVTKVVIHHNWVQSLRVRVEVENDIAILKTKNAFEFNNLVKPACLPESTSATVNPGDECWIAGFGASAGTNKNRRTGKVEDETKLRHTNINIISNNICMNELNSEILSNQICAGNLNNGADSCRGDSGGPLVCPNSRTSSAGDRHTYTVHGIVSWGKECGREISPGVYTRVASYRSWIDSIIRRM